MTEIEIEIHYQVENSYWEKKQGKGIEEEEWWFRLFCLNYSSVFTLFSLCRSYTHHMYYDYILFLVRFLFSLELMTSLARGLDRVLVCLSTTKILAESLPRCKMILTRVKQVKTYQFHILPPAGSIAVSWQLFFTIVLRNPFASSMSQIPCYLIPCLFLS